MPPIQTILSTDTLQTEKAGADLAKVIASDPSAPSCVCLFGDLGAGKTVFVRGMAGVLSPGSRAVSPTYSLVREYDRGPRPFLHYDMYRVRGEDDLVSTGFFDVDDAVTAIEWSENIRPFLPSPRWEVTIEKKGENARAITIERTGDPPPESRI